MVPKEAILSFCIVLSTLFWKIQAEPSVIYDAEQVDLVGHLLLYAQFGQNSSAVIEVDNGVGALTYDANTKRVALNVLPADPKASAKPQIQVREMGPTTREDWQTDRYSEVALFVGFYAQHDLKFGYTDLNGEFHQMSRGTGRVDVIPKREANSLQVSIEGKVEFKTIEKPAVKKT